ncbi:hypothetical protein [Paenibacillus sp. NPDC057934]|uniref:hypothetical protein n=1 Tax=Paenibacillus sp. NPDC057934 TaxID=3346282 RepID=UPI0036DC2419
MNSKLLKNRFYDDLPRANLEIADTFANAFESSRVTSEAWNLILKWVNQTVADAPINTPCEFLPFCALQALGLISIMQIF